MPIPTPYIPRSAEALITASRDAETADNGTPALNLVGRLGQERLDDFTRSGAAGLERQVLASGGRRTMADVDRIGTSAGSLAEQAYATAEGTLSRQQRAITGGATLDPREAAAQQRRLGLARARGGADARNRAFRADRDRRDEVRGESFGMRDMIDDLVFASSGAAGNMEASRYADYQRQRAARRNALASSIGSIAGMAVGAFAGGG